MSNENVPLQDINDKKYAAYLTVRCNDEVKAELLAALDMIWSYPAGQEKIIQAANRGGVLANDSKLEIICDASVEETAYGAPDEGVNAEEGLMGHLLLYILILLKGEKVKMLKAINL